MQVLYPDGPVGLEAARLLAPPDVLPEPRPTVAEVLAAVDAAAVDHDTLGVVPLESSHTGPDPDTVDGLVFATRDVVVVAETDLVTVETGGGEVTMRWVTVGTRPPMHVVDPQTLLFVIPQLNRPGTLLELLAAFSSRGCNLTRFATRPLRGGLGMYGFLLEVEGSPADAWMQDALADVLGASSHLKFLGTFAAGQRAWSPVTGVTPAGRDLRTLSDLSDLAEHLGGHDS